MSTPSVELHSKCEARVAGFRASGPSGAKASAVIYSIVETAKENVLNPFAYLCHLFERLPNIDLADPYAIHELLPYSTSLPPTVEYANNNVTVHRPLPYIKVGKI